MNNLPIKAELGKMMPEPEIELVELKTVKLIVPKAMKWMGISYLALCENGEAKVGVQQITPEEIEAGEKIIILDK